MESASRRTACELRIENALPVFARVLGPGRPFPLSECEQRLTFPARLGSVESPSAAVRLPLAFYERPALIVARELIGKVLAHQRGSDLRAGRIVETEAYVGEHDLACHASRGRTRRTEVLFGPPGRAYVYFIYGMYYCFNVVTEPEGVASAVLVRALEPLSGIPSGLSTDGPGKLCRALGITLSQNREDLRGDCLFIEDAPAV